MKNEAEFLVCKVNRIKEKMMGACFPLNAEFGKFLDAQRLGEND